MKTKICNKCKKIKLISEFSKCKVNKDGYNYWCKKCHKKYDKNRYKDKKYREKKLRRMKEYRENNKEKVKESDRKHSRKYYNNNKEKILKQMKIYYKNLKSWIKTYRRIRDRCNCKSSSDYYRYGGRGIKCLITKEELKYLWFRDKAYLMENPSIDRKNNDGNYILENCRYIELSENVRKRKKELKI